MQVKVNIPIAIQALNSINLSKKNPLTENEYWQLMSMMEFCGVANDCETCPYISDCKKRFDSVCEKEYKRG